MIFKKHGLKALGLCLVAALGLMAFAASAAQAVPVKDGGWLVGTAGTELAANETATGAWDVQGPLLVAAKNLSLNCTEVEVVNGVLLPLNAAHESIGHATLLFKQCTALNKTTGAELPCHVLLPGGAGGGVLHITANVLFVVVLEAGEAFVLAYPTAGLTEPFTEVLFTGATCPLPELTPIKGTLLLALTAGLNNPQLAVAATPALQTKFGDELKFGANPAILDGSANISLASGAAWGIN